MMIPLTKKQKTLRAPGSGSSTYRSTLYSWAASLVLILAALPAAAPLAYAKVQPKGELGRDSEPHSTKPPDRSPDLSSGPSEQPLDKRALAQPSEKQAPEQRPDGSALELDSPAPNQAPGLQPDGKPSPDEAAAAQNQAVNPPPSHLLPSLAPPAEDLALLVGQTRRAQIFATPAAERLARSLLDSVEADRDTIALDLGRDYDGLTQIRIAHDQASFDALLPPPVRLPTWAQGVAFPSLNLVVIRAGDQHLLSTTRGTLRHELSHIAIGRLATGHVPRWFLEGLATVHSGDAWSRKGPSLVRAALADGLFSFDSLRDSFPAMSLDAELAYAQSADFVSFLIDRGGEDRLGELLRLLVDGQDFDDAIRETFGASLRSLENEWRRGMARWELIARMFTGVEVWWGALTLLAIFAWFVVRRRQKLRLWEMQQEEEEEDRLIAKARLLRALRLQAEREEANLQMGWEGSTQSGGYSEQDEDDEELWEESEDDDDDDFDAYADAYHFRVGQEDDSEAQDSEDSEDREDEALEALNDSAQDGADQQEPNLEDLEAQAPGARQEAAPQDDPVLAELEAQKAQAAKDAEQSADKDSAVQETRGRTGDGTHSASSKPELSEPPSRASASEPNKDPALTRKSSTQALKRPLDPYGGKKPTIH